MSFFKVQEWMRHDVKGMTGIRSIVFVLPKALHNIETAKLRAPSEESVRHVIKGIKDATSDYRSRFLNTAKKVCCVRIPREIFSRDLLEQLDTGMSRKSSNGCHFQCYNPGRDLRLLIYSNYGKILNRGLTVLTER